MLIKDLIHSLAVGVPVLQQILSRLGILRKAYATRLLLAAASTLQFQTPGLKDTLLLDLSQLNSTIVAFGSNRRVGQTGSHGGIIVEKESAMTLFTLEILVLVFVHQLALGQTDAVSAILGSTDIPLATRVKRSKGKTVGFCHFSKLGLQGPRDVLLESFEKRQFLAADTLWWVFKKVHKVLNLFRIHQLVFATLLAARNLSLSKY
jgi:hypothetical protein